MYKHLYKILPVTLLLPLTSIAEEAKPAVATTSINMTLLSLLTLIFVLLLAIGILANSLSNLAAVYRTHLRKKRNATLSSAAKTISLLLLLFVAPFSLVQAAEPTEAAAATEAAANAAPSVIAGMPAFDFYLLISIIVVEILVIIALLVTMMNLQSLISRREVEGAVAPAAKKRSFWDRFNQTVAIEKEQDIMLDHSYDGIQELDNSLPPWWKYGFYLTIIVSIFYLYYYHIGNGPTQLDELAMEMKEGEAQKAKYLSLSANNIDENTVKMSDDAGIAAGKTLFETNCAACHAKDGGGTVGPNLTDVYWLHGGSLSDVFKSIKYGWPDKGMKSWKDDFSPKQIADIASFIETLKGTKPAVAKEPQGEAYTAEATTTTTETKATDSTTAAQ